MSITPPLPAKSAQMSRVKNSNTAPEMAIRRELYRRGLRYRVNMILPQMCRIRPDLVFLRSRVAVFVDGCFWHRCPEHGTSPQTNREWWRKKLDTNVSRDRAADSALVEEGWKVIRIWEHENVMRSADLIEETVRKRASRPSKRTSWKPR